MKRFEVILSHVSGSTMASQVWADDVVEAEHLVAVNLNDIDPVGEWSYLVWEA